MIIDILELQNIKINGIFDDNQDIRSISGYKVAPYSGDMMLSDEKVIISIGNNRTRKIIVGQYQFNYASAVHSQAVISKSVKIGTGTVIMGNATVNSDTVIKDHVIINTSSSIDHDCKIDDFVHIAPGAVLCGDVKVNEGSLIGAGTVILPGVNIGCWCIVGAGSVIIRDIPDFSVVVGNPGRVIKNLSNE